MRSRAIVFLVLVSAPFSAFAQKKDAAGDKKPKPTATDSLAVEQSRIADKYAKLEQLLLRMSDVEALTNPRRSALLKRAAKQSTDRLTRRQLNAIVEMIRGKKLKRAIAGQTQAHTDIKALLTLLLSENRANRLKSEEQRIKKYIKRINKLIRQQISNKGRNEGGDDPQEVAKEQGRIADQTKNLGDDIKKNEEGDTGDQQGNKSKSKSGKKSDQQGKGKDQKGKDGKNSKSGKDSQGSKNSKSGKGSQQKAGKDGKNQKGKAGKSLKGSKQKAGKQSKGSKSKSGKQGKGSKSKSGKQGKGSKSKSGKQGKGSKSKSGKQGKGSKSKGSQSKGKQSKGSQQQGNQNQQQQQQQQQQNPVRKQLEEAEQEMRKAQQELEKAKRKESIEAQEKARQALEQAKAKLEEILRQLREEEVERMLALLEGRFRRMLTMQIRVYEETKTLAKTPKAKRKRETQIKAARLSFDQRKIIREADKAHELLLEEGSSIALPETVDVMREEMEVIAKRLDSTKIDRFTQSSEEEVIRTLEEIIEALQKAQQDMEQKKQQQKQQKQRQGRQQPQPLVDQIAELKMIRALQLRVNKRTKRYANFLEDEEDVKGEFKDEEMRDAMKRLAKRETRIQRITQDIVLGKNK